MSKISANLRTDARETNAQRVQRSRSGERARARPTHHRLPTAVSTKLTFTSFDDQLKERAESSAIEWPGTAVAPANADSAHAAARATACRNQRLSMNTVNVFRER